MFSTDPSKHWRRWGSSDPYYAVLTSDEYRSDRLDEKARAEFFATGEQCITEALATIRDHLAPGFAPERCLDFGCGVGRLTLALARRANEAVGLDVSPSMLAEAQRNATAAGVTNAVWLESDATLSKVTGTFDLVYSIIVFHHIRPELGMNLLRRQLELLRPGGVLAVQLLYALHQPAPIKAARWVQAHVPLANMVVNAAKRRPLATPNMEANVYDLPAVLEMLQDCGIHTTYVELTREQACSHAMIYARRPA